MLSDLMVNRLMVSRYWSSSAFLVSYEQAGGWYDQAPPPTTAAGTLGLRVPAVLISAYARQGVIDGTLSDPAGALRFIEANWRLPALSAADADAGSLAGAFDFGAGPRPAKLLPGFADAPTTAVTRPDTAAVTVLYCCVGALCLALLCVAALATLRRSRPRAEPAGVS